MQYEDFYRRSIESPEEFWAEQAQAIHWHVPPQKILDYSNPPFRKWFVGGQTNLCYNAVDRHLEERGDQLALVGWSTETDSVRELTFREAHVLAGNCVLPIIGGLLVNAAYNANPHWEPAPKKPARKRVVRRARR